MRRSRVSAISLKNDGGEEFSHEHQYVGVSAMNWLRVCAALVAFHLVAALLSPLRPNRTIRLNANEYLQFRAVLPEVFLFALPFLVCSVIALGVFYWKKSVPVLVLSYLLAIPGIVCTGYLGIFLLLASGIMMLIRVCRIVLAKETEG
ncbi:hypothetical protein G7Y41_00805 [Schaalia sp. ZJ405]|uniref:hypothetical protein n=1 Tax=Schaalia sp. ZJ405 TaxID=2709403 RepID=UPI0013EA1FA8|nr:hypothetical protein [Schaalia sp. ZJ405]QPK81451.1 hypothetical protein G7Y41_00805 [Schaalia sp. ZJ405]